MLLEIVQSYLVFYSTLLILSNYLTLQKKVQAAGLSMHLILETVALDPLVFLIEKIDDLATH